MLYHIEHGFEKHVAEIWVKFFSRSKNKFHTSYKKDMLPFAPIFVFHSMCYVRVLWTRLRVALSQYQITLVIFPLTVFFIMKMIDLLKVGFTIATIY